MSCTKRVWPVIFIRMLSFIFMMTQVWQCRGPTMPSTGSSQISSYPSLPGSEDELLVKLWKLNVLAVRESDRIVIVHPKNSILPRRLRWTRLPFYHWSLLDVHFWHPSITAELAGWHLPTTRRYSLMRAITVGTQAPSETKLEPPSPPHFTVGGRKIHSTSVLALPPWRSHLSRSSLGLAKFCLYICPIRQSALSFCSVQSAFSVFFSVVSINRVLRALHINAIPLIPP